jgi:hypothetical protein
LRRCAASASPSERTMHAIADAGDEVFADLVLKRTPIGGNS